MNPIMRRSGVLTQWNDERGYGFIEQATGGQRVFVHVSEYPKDAPRPYDGDELSFEIGVGADGRRQALAIEVVRSARPVVTAVVRNPAPIDWLPISVVPAFAVLFVLVCVYWPVPLWLIVLYPAMSLITFFMYLLDKQAAMDFAWRLRENSLQIVALFGGWPGAVIAQQVLRHKNRKRSFQAVFWCLVVLNVAFFVVLVWFGGDIRAYLEGVLLRAAE
jgi:uncharacterized membrane protein YsdA (DUF1294 family)/cold shock CspA family protein